MTIADQLEPSLRALLTSAVAQLDAEKRAKAAETEVMTGGDVNGYQRKKAAEAVLANLVRVCQCCAVKSSQRPLVKADNEGTLLCLKCYHDLTGKPYEPPKPVPKPRSFGGWS